MRDEIERLLLTLSSAAIGDLGEETARFHLERDGAIIVDVDDSRMSREGGRHGLDITAAIDGELIGFEVKARYQGRAAGSLTRTGDLPRPRFRRARALRDGSLPNAQGTVAYTAERIEHVAEVDGDPIVRVVVVDLRARLLQIYAVEGGKIEEPLGPPVDCTDAIEAGIDAMLGHRGHL